MGTTKNGYDASYGPKTHPRSVDLASTLAFLAPTATADLIMDFGPPGLVPSARMASSIAS